MNYSSDLSSSSSDNESYNESWDQEDNEIFKCPFCPSDESNLTCFLDHCIKMHEFDFVSIKLQSSRIIF